MNKNRFMLEECWILAWNASVQRARLYSADTSEPRRRTFRLEVLEFIDTDIIPHYRSPVSEENHLKNLDRLIVKAEAIGSELLAEGYKYGVAQKLLNLMLKYYWCLGEVEEPPHCPVDRIILKETDLRGKFNWTQMKGKADYLKAIRAIEKITNGKSLSVYELENYNSG